jgi:hypothetical protein
LLVQTHLDRVGRNIQWGKLRGALFDGATANQDEQ